MLTKREVAIISFFASIFSTVNAQISLVRFAYIANGINSTALHFSEFGSVDAYAIFEVFAEK